MPPIENPYRGLTGGSWLKSNLHTPATQSDGVSAPHAVIDDYARRIVALFGGATRFALAGAACLAAPTMWASSAGARARPLPGLSRSLPRRTESVRLTRPVALLGLGLWLAVAGCADRVLGPVRAALLRADSLAARVAEEVSSEGATPYEIDASGTTISFSCPEYTATVRRGHPFGITSLRLPDQPVDFANPALPLGDWEWFWFDRGHGRISAKLVDHDWGSPALEELPDQAILRFTQRDVLEPGIDLSVGYRLDTQAAGFQVQYTVDNHSGKQLARPYIMVGFPGFSNHVWVSEVATAIQTRVPDPPSSTFLSEAMSRDRFDYVLLRHDVDPHVNPLPLAGRIALTVADRRYVLEASCAAGPGMRWVYSAHTIKRSYLTSHLYVFLTDMEDGDRRQVLVRYVLRRSP